MKEIKVNTTDLTQRLLTEIYDEFNIPEISRNTTYLEILARAILKLRTELKMTHEREERKFREFPQICTSYGGGDYGGGAMHRVHLGAEEVYASKDSRDAQMFAAELKGRLLMNKETIL